MRGVPTSLCSGKRPPVFRFELFHSGFECRADLIQAFFARHVRSVLFMHVEHVEHLVQVSRDLGQFDGEIQPIDRS